LIRHNKIRDLAEVGHEVQVESHLQPITGEQSPLDSSGVNDGAHLDISVNDFWGDSCERIFLDIKVLIPMLQAIILKHTEEFTDVMRCT